MADRFQAIPQNLKHALLAEVRKLLAEAPEIAEGVLVDKADETEQFQERILKGRRSQQQFLLLRERLLQRIRDDVGWLVNVAEPMGLIDDH